MNTVVVDDEVLRSVWRLANPKPFENLDFNSALRRILQLDSTDENHSALKKQKASFRASQILDSQKTQASIPTRGKNPKADLRTLVRIGLLSNGEELHLVDYKGNRIGQFAATISNNSLFFDGEYKSMSALARKLLKKVGYKSNAVRGPAHWVTSDDISIKGLWEKHLEEN